MVQNFIKLFADVTKLYARVDNDEQRRSLQNDLDSVLDWSSRWQLIFNTSKCKHLHLGPDSNNDYMMDGRTIKKTTEEKDLGIIIDQNLKFKSHIASSVKKANRKLGFIYRTFTCLNKDMFLNLYKSLVSPHLEYGSAVWSVIYKKDAVSIENVQRRATRLLSNIRHLSYTERLRYLGLPTLQYRRMRADVIQVYKIVHGIDKVDENLFEIPPVHRTRGNSKRIYKKHSRLNTRKCFFSQRVVNTWNSLPDQLVCARTLNTFKNLLNEHWKTHPIKFTPDFWNPSEVMSSHSTNETDHRGPRSTQISTPRAQVNITVILQYC